MTPEHSVPFVLLSFFFALVVVLITSLVMNDFLFLSNESDYLPLANFRSLSAFPRVCRPPFQADAKALKLLKTLTRVNL